MSLQPSASAAKWGDLGVRSLSAAVLIPAVLADVWAGGIWFNLFVALIGILMAQEWVTIVHRGNPLQFALHAAAAMCGALLPIDVGLPGSVLAIAVLTALSAFAAAREEPGGPAWRYLGIPYVSLPLMALVVLRQDAVHGIAAIVLVMLMVWFADTLAYFAGRIIGGPKLAPRISPKKTWAGMGGAMAGSVLAALGVALTLGLPGLWMLLLVRILCRLLSGGMCLRVRI
jgi:phosphatidate cytidylyltransferase